MRIIFAILLIAAGGYYALSSDDVIPDRWNYIPHGVRARILPMTCGVILGILIGVLI